MPRWSRRRSVSEMARSRQRADDFLEGTDLPRNWLYKVTTPAVVRSRRWKFEFFMAHMRPTPAARILDVGVCNKTERATNFLESWYPWPQQITAVSIDPVPDARDLFPDVTFVTADGRSLPFEDKEFDIGFSNAVIEHVGTREQQRAFAGELMRCCRAVFVATPNRHFPIDPHTLYPLVHWLPPVQRRHAYTLLGRPGWSTVDALNPLSAHDLRQCFATASEVRIVRQRLLGLTSNLILMATA